MNELLDTLAGREGGVGLSSDSDYAVGSCCINGLEKRARFRYSYQELIPAPPALDKAAQAAGKKTVGIEICMIERRSSSPIDWLYSRHRFRHLKMLD